MTLGSTRLQVEPGGQVQFPVSIRNQSQLVESFRMDLVGLDPDWWQVEPPDLAVYPGREDSVLVVLRPPVQVEIPEGAIPFGVRARSSRNQACSVVEEGELEVGRVLDLQATIEPVTSKGRWWSTHRLVYTNWGNSTAVIRVSASDVDQDLGFKITPEELSVPVGAVLRPSSGSVRGVPFFEGRRCESRSRWWVIPASRGARPVWCFGQECRSRANRCWKQPFSRCRSSRGESRWGWLCCWPGLSALSWPGS